MATTQNPYQLQSRRQGNKKVTNVLCAFQISRNLNRPKEGDALVSESTSQEGGRATGCYSIGRSATLAKDIDPVVRAACPLAKLSAWCWSRAKHEWKMD